MAVVMSDPPVPLTDSLDPLDPFTLPVTPPPRHRRPRAVRHAQRTAWLHLRLLPSERTRLTAAARRAGRTDTSSWARGTLLAACDGEDTPMLDAEASKAVERLRRDLNSGVGSNLNQALAHANAAARAGGAMDEDALLAAVASARAAMEALHADLQRLLGPQGRA